MAQLACALILLVGVQGILNAQQPAEEPAYRVQSEVTVTGTVAKVFTYTGQRGTPRSRATITTADGAAVDVHLGPSSFVTEKQMELAVGDRVTVIGSRAMTGMVIVRRLTRNGRTLELRNAAGRPLWEDRHR